MPRPYHVLEYEIDFAKNHPSKQSRRNKRLQQLGSSQCKSNESDGERASANQLGFYGFGVSPPKLKKNSRLKRKSDDLKTVDLEPSQLSAYTGSLRHEEEENREAVDHPVSKGGLLDHSVEFHDVNPADYVYEPLSSFFERSDQRMARFGPDHIRASGQRKIDNRVEETRAMAKINKRRLDRMLDRLQSDIRQSGVGSKGGHIARELKAPGPLNGHRKISRKDSFLSPAEIGLAVEGRAKPKLVYYRDLGHPETGWNHRFIASHPLHGPEERPMTAPEKKSRTHEFREEVLKLRSSDFAPLPRKLDALEFSKTADNDKPRKSPLLEVVHPTKRKNMAGMPLASAKRSVQTDLSERSGVSGSPRNWNRPYTTGSVEDAGKSPLEGTLQKLHVQVTESHFAVAKFSSRRDQYGYLPDPNAPFDHFESTDECRNEQLPNDPDVNAALEDRWSQSHLGSSFNEVDEDELYATIVRNASQIGGASSKSHTERFDISEDDHDDNENKFFEEEGSVMTLIEVAELVWTTLMEELRAAGRAISLSDLSELATLREPAESVAMAIGYISLLVGLKADWKVVMSSLLRRVKVLKEFLDAVDPLMVPMRRVRKAMELKKEKLLRESCSTMEAKCRSMGKMFRWVQAFDAIAEVVTITVNGRRNYQVREEYTPEVCVVSIPVMEKVEEKADGSAPDLNYENIDLGLQRNTANLDDGAFNMNMNADEESRRKDAGEEDLQSFLHRLSKQKSILQKYSNIDLAIYGINRDKTETTLTNANDDDAVESPQTQRETFSAEADRAEAAEDERDAMANYYQNLFDNDSTASDPSYIKTGLFADNCSKVQSNADANTKPQGRPPPSPLSGKPPSRRHENLNIGSTSSTTSGGNDANHIRTELTTARSDLTTESVRMAQADAAKAGTPALDIGAAVAAAQALDPKPYPTSSNPNTGRNTGRDTGRTRDTGYTSELTSAMGFTIATPLTTVLPIQDTNDPFLLGGDKKSSKVYQARKEKQEEEEEYQNYANEDDFEHESELVTPSKTDVGSDSSIAEPMNPLLTGENTNDIDDDIAKETNNSCATVTALSEVCENQHMERTEENSSEEISNCAKPTWHDASESTLKAHSSSSVLGIAINDDNVQDGKTVDAGSDQVNETSVNLTMNEISSPEVDVKASNEFPLINDEPKGDRRDIDGMLAVSMVVDAEVQSTVSPNGDLEREEEVLDNAAHNTDLAELQAEEKSILCSDEVIDHDAEYADEEYEAFEQEDDQQTVRHGQSSRTVDMQKDPQGLEESEYDYDNEFEVFQEVEDTHDVDAPEERLYEKSVKAVNTSAEDSMAIIIGAVHEISPEVDNQAQIKEYHHQESDNGSTDATIFAQLPADCTEDRADDAVNEVCKDYSTSPEVAVNAEKASDRHCHSSGDVNSKLPEGEAQQNNNEEHALNDDISVLTSETASAAGSCLEAPSDRIGGSKANNSIEVIAESNAEILFPLQAMDTVTDSPGRRKKKSVTFGVTDDDQVHYFKPYIGVEGDTDSASGSNSVVERSAVSMPSESCHENNLTPISATITPDMIQQAVGSFTVGDKVLVNILHCNCNVEDDSKLNWMPGTVSNVRYDCSAEDAIPNYDIDLIDGSKVLWVAPPYIVSHSVSNQQNMQVADPRTPEIRALPSWAHCPFRIEEYKEGDRVIANYREEGKWLNGRIVGVHRADDSDIMSKRFDIQYQSGEMERKVLARNIRLCNADDNILDQPLPVSTFKIGTPVKANYRGKGTWLPGRVVRDRGGGVYDIAYDDGDVEHRVSVDMLQLFDYSIVEGGSSFKDGQRVTVNFRGTGTWFSGVIMRSRGHGLYDILYDDTDVEYRVSASMIRHEESEQQQAIQEARPRRDLSKYAEHRKVLVNYQSSGNWFAGVIIRDRGHGVYDIDYDDGDKELFVDEDLLKPLDDVSGKLVDNATDELVEENEAIDDVKELCTSLYEVGSGVLVNIRNENVWIEGTVSKVRQGYGVKEHSCYDIDLLDGTKEVWVDNDLIIPISSYDKGIHKTWLDRTKFTLCEQYEIGDRVMANFLEQGKWHAGTISALCSDGCTFEVDYDDGRKERKVSSHCLRRNFSKERGILTRDSISSIVVRYREGLDVEANYRGQGEWKPGIISRVRGEGIYDVNFSDGTSEIRVGENMIRTVASLPNQPDRRKRISHYSQQINLFEVGKRVKVNFRGTDVWKVGVISRDRGDGIFDVLYDDGTVEVRVGVEMIQIAFDTADFTGDIELASKYSIGEDVEVNYRGCGVWYTGKIVSDLGQGVYDVVDEDGVVENWVGEAMLRTITGEPSGIAGLISKYEVGMRIEANYRRTGKWYAGIISRDRGHGVYDVVYDDGEKELRVSEKLINPVSKGSLSYQYEEGQRIEAEYRESGHWFPGRIFRSRVDGTYDVQYDDDEIESKIPERKIRSSIYPVESISNSHDYSLQNKEGKVSEIKNDEGIVVFPWFDSDDIFFWSGIKEAENIDTPVDLLFNATIDTASVTMATIDEDNESLELINAPIGQHKVDPDDFFFDTNLKIIGSDPGKDEKSVDDYAQSNDNKKDISQIKEPRNSQLVREGSALEKDAIHNGLREEDTPPFVFEPRPITPNM